MLNVNTDCGGIWHGDGGGIDGLRTVRHRQNPVFALSGVSTHAAPTPIPPTNGTDGLSLSGICHVSCGDHRGGKSDRGIPCHRFGRGWGGILDVGLRIGLYDGKIF